MPVVLFQVWQFVAPGLYKREKRFAVPLLVSSIVLFYAGMAFAYFVVFRLMFAFFVNVTPTGVDVRARHRRVSRLSCSRCSSRSASRSRYRSRP